MAFSLQVQSKNLISNHLKEVGKNFRKQYVPANQAPFTNK